MGPSSVRPTRTCSPGECGQWFSTAPSTRSQPSPASSHGSPTTSLRPTWGSRSSSSSAERAGPARCALAGHGQPVVRRVSKLLRRVRREPIPAPTATPRGRLNYGELLTALYPALGSPATWPGLARDLEAAVEGAVRLSRPRREAPRKGSGPPSCPQGDQLRGHPGLGRGRRPGRASSIGSPGSVASAARFSVGGCGPHAPRGRARAPTADTGPWTARTRTPILVVGTTFDPATSFANARRVAGLLGNSVLLTHTGYGHVSVSDPRRRLRRARHSAVPAPRRAAAARHRLPIGPQALRPELRLAGASSKPVHHRRPGLRRRLHRRARDWPRSTGISTSVSMRSSGSSSRSTSCSRSRRFQPQSWRGAWGPRGSPRPAWRCSLSVVSSADCPRRWRR